MCVFAFDYSVPFAVHLRGFGSNSLADLCYFGKQALQAACQRLNTYVQQLEEKMDAAERKKK